MKFSGKARRILQVGQGSGAEVKVCMYDVYNTIDTEYSVQIFCTDTIQ